MNVQAFKPTPLESFDRLHSQLSMIKAQKIGVYDNRYAKPSQSGPPTNARFSVTVIFSVNDILHYGQYDFENGIWSTLPSDEKMRRFYDRVVQFWFYPPGSVELFDKYAEDVRSGMCRDEVSRLDEYDPERQEFYTDTEIPPKTAEDA